LRILVAEDEQDIASSYKLVLERQGHEVFLSINGEECVSIYTLEAQKAELESKAEEPLRVYDVVILDYRMPKMDGIETAKEILALNPRQRIVFASAYVQAPLVDLIKELRQPVELMRKPFTSDALVDTIEDRNIYDELRMMNVSVEALRSINPTHEQLKSLFEGLKKLQKYKT